ncbi:beta-lactamase family protein [Bacillus sp. Bva_UNVM-123]|uniref:serine hydrolase domain-containing protein n=1 Tax=Bacillus sp. Bva_UNVM-123 TaxID=2829798 RepID=UPI00391F5C87
MGKRILKWVGVAVGLLAIGIFILNVKSAYFNPNKYEGDKVEKIAQYMEDRGKDFQGSLLVAEGDKIIFEKGYGWADKQNKIKNDPNSQYQTASLTKSFTAAAILKLEEDGLLHTSDKLSVYLPNFPNGEKITLHHLLTQTSGIYNYTEAKFDQTKKVRPEELVSWFEGKELEFETGTKFAYSNSNYILLGLMIEKVSGVPYEKYVAENIFKPAQLNHTTAIREEASNLSVGYEGKKKASFLDNSIPYAAGMIISTTEDLFKYTKAIHDGTLLNPSSIEKLFTPEHSNYAYGWISTKAFGENIHWHNGAISGFKSALMYYPEKDYTIIFLSNNVLIDVDTMALELSAILFNEKLTFFNW